MANQVYRIVTDRVIRLLEQGTVPWRKPWAGGPAQWPKNLVSGQQYRGINVFLLSAAGFESPWWLTYKQAQQRGGHVRKGEESSVVVFYKDWDTGKTDDDGKPVRVPVLRYYRVFNVAQCEGFEYSRPDLPERDFRPIERCESVVSGMPKRPAIEHREARAYYRPSTDTVNMPRAALFESDAAYYSVLFHELTHSTGHRSRLDRSGITKAAAFGSAEYSREELIAEMGAAFLCGHCAIETHTIENSAAYIDSWLGRLRRDPKLVVQAASKAQAAADFILG